MVTVANVHDSKAAYLLMRVLKELCSGIKVILADGGCRGELIGNIKNKLVMEFKWLLVHAYKEQGFNLFIKMDCGKDHSRRWTMTEGSVETMN